MSDWLNGKPDREPKRKPKGNIPIELRSFNERLKAKLFTFVLDVFGLAACILLVAAMQSSCDARAEASVPQVKVFASPGEGSQ